MSTDLEMLQRSTEMLADAVALVAPAALASPTPCADWTVTDLVDHVTGGNRFTMNILSGMTADEALDGARRSFGDDHDPLAAVDDSAGRQLQAFSQPGVLDAIHHHIMGDLLGHQVLRLRLHDLGIHTWDLRQAVHPGEALDPVYTRWAIAELAKDDSATERHIATGVGNPTNAAELLMAFGRHPARRTAKGQPT